MDSSKPHITLGIAWLGTVLTFIVHYWSPILSVGVAVAAIIASIHSARANNAKRKFYVKEAEKLDKTP